MEPQRGLSDPAQGQAVLEDRPRSLRLLEIFLRLVPEQVTALVQASGGDDLESIRERAHKLKGSALSIGALRMAKLCEVMQEAAEARDASYLTTWAAGVAAELHALKPRLEGELSRKRTHSNKGSL